MKSLKLYLNAFRNLGAFHEDCTVAIGQRVAELLAPQWLRIGGYFYPRGGMPINVFWQSGNLPEGVWVPDQGMPPIGRGARRLLGAAKETAGSQLRSRTRSLRRSTG